MAALVGGDAEVRLVPDAGHAAHLERPQAFLDVVRPGWPSTAPEPALTPSPRGHRPGAGRPPAGPCRWRRGRG
jgi:hypothetical protein